MIIYWKLGLNVLMKLVEHLSKCRRSLNIHEIIIFFLDSKTSLCNYVNELITMLIDMCTIVNLI